MTRIFHAVFPERFGRISGIVVVHMLGGSRSKLQGPPIVVMVTSRELAINDVNT